MEMNLETLAEKSLMAGDLATAISLWEELASQGASAKKIGGWIAQLHGFHHSRKSEKLLHFLLNQADGDVEDFLSVAKIFFEKARFDVSAKLTEHALEKSPGDADTVVMLASSLERTDQKDEAIKLLHNVLEKHPKHSRAVRQLARIERRNGKYNEAKKRLAQHLANHPSREDWRLQYELAAVQDRLGEYQAAMKVLKKAKEQIAFMAPREQAEQQALRQWQITQEINTARLAQWHEASPHLTPQLKICLVAGFPRSGTTLLENIISSHSQCIATDETGILETQFRNPLVLQAASAGEVIKELDSFDPEDVSAGRAEYLRCTEDYIGEDVGSRLLLEKEPLLTADLAVPLRLFPDSKIIMPIRDPRDVVISYFFTMVPFNIASAGSESMESSCRAYADVMRHWLHLKQVIPESKWMESRYEDLLEKPEDQTRKIADFLGVEWSDTMLSHHKNRGKRKVSTPTYDDVSKPLYKRSLARWKSYEDELAPHLHHLEPYLEAFGYE